MDVILILEIYSNISNIPARSQPSITNANTPKQEISMNSSRENTQDHILTEWPISAQDEDEKCMPRTVTTSLKTLAPDEWLVLTPQTSASRSQFIVVDGRANIDRADRKGMYKLNPGESVEMTANITVVIRNLTNTLLSGILVKLV